MSTNIAVQRTPNPNAMKFSLGQPVVAGNGSRTFGSRAAAQGDRIAEPLFEIAGVQSVFMVADFVTVIKTPEASWDELVPHIVSSLQEVFR
jgi:scaffold Nfu/NifU family protein